MNPKKYFKLFACCIPVKGATMSVICDLQRNNYLYIPGDLYDILTEFNNPVPADIKEYYEHENDAVIDEYFEVLIEKEYGFWTDSPDSFPDLDMSFETPEKINNAIIDIGKNSTHDFEKIFFELDVLQCKFLELRFFKAVPLNYIAEILDKCLKKRFRNVNLYIHYLESETEKSNIFNRLIARYPFIGEIIIHSSPEDRNLFEERLLIRYITQQITDASCCGYISERYFRINTRFFTESKNYNNCLNKKMSIDETGAIKNCPAMKRSFGDHKQSSLLAAAIDTNFTDIWNINKDQVIVCKDCQFRYICSDCRAFVKELTDKPLRCGYDPYTNTWSNK